MSSSEYKNQEVSDILRRISKYYSILGDTFRSLAYRNAASTIENLSDDVAKFTEEELVCLPSIGKSIGSKINEYLTTGKIKAFEELRLSLSGDKTKLELYEIEGFGKSSIDSLYQYFDIKSIDDVEEILESRAALMIPGFKEKKISKLLESLKEHNSGGIRRNVPLIEAMKTAVRLVKLIQSGVGVHKIAIAGSIRRLKSKINDIDILVSENELNLGKSMLRTFTSSKHVKRIIASGDSKASVILDNGIQADMRVVKPNEFYTALQYFTGSKEHNIELRKIAKEKGFKLSEYSLTKRNTGERIEIDSEEKLYKILGVKYLKPEKR